MQTTYRTTDIVLAACLKLKQYKLATIEKEGNKGIFVFENVPSDVITEYDLGNWLVEPIMFNNMIKQLTTSVFRAM